MSRLDPTPVTTPPPSAQASVPAPERPCVGTYNAAARQIAPTKTAQRGVSAKESNRTANNAQISRTMVATKHDDDISETAISSEANEMPDRQNQRTVIHACANASPTTTFQSAERRTSPIVRDFSLSELSRSSTILPSQTRPFRTFIIPGTSGRAAFLAGVDTCSS